MDFTLLRTNIQRFACLHREYPRHESLQRKIGGRMLMSRKLTMEGLRIHWRAFFQLRREERLFWQNISILLTHIAARYDVANDLFAQVLILSFTPILLSFQITIVLHFPSPLFRYQKLSSIYAILC